MSTDAASQQSAQHQWGVPSVDEPRWPASLAVVAAIVLYVTLPTRFTLGPVWLLPILEVALLAPLTFVAPRRKADEPPWQRFSAVALIALVNAANVVSLVLLVIGLVHSGKVNGHVANGSTLIQAAVQIWLTNVLVFALWYWELDRGGPDQRSHVGHRQPDFLFPQMTTPGCTTKDWVPSFVDYLYVAATNAAAFSPTDTMPLTPWAKMLMLVQSLTSLITIALVAGRAVNILN